jgi:hypothetical protein
MLRSARTSRRSEVPADVIEFAPSGLDVRPGPGARIDRPADSLTGLLQELARSGEYTEAERLARSMPGFDTRAIALTQLAILSSAAGRPGWSYLVAEGERATENIDSAEHSADALAHLAALHAASEHPADAARIATAAETMARTIPASRARPLAVVSSVAAQAMISVGRSDDAGPLAETILSPLRRARVLIGVAQAVIATDSNERSSDENTAALLTEAEALMVLRETPAWLAVRAALAAAWMAAGSRHEAEKLITRTSSRFKPYLMDRLVEELVADGIVSGARCPVRRRVRAGRRPGR